MSDITDPQYHRLLAKHRDLITLVDGTLGAAGDDYLTAAQRQGIESQIDAVAADLAAIEWEHYDRNHPLGDYLAQHGKEVTK
ncbi:hypothetical protein EBS80_02320 [bacterium]|nr:hypothetical protein [bacterium]